MTMGNEEDPNSKSELFYGEIVDSIIGDVASESHRIARLGLDRYLDLEEEELRLSTEARARTADPSHSGEDSKYIADIYGQTHPAIAKDILNCMNCGRPVVAGRFAPHLEKCMGKGRNARPKSTRSTTAAQNQPAKGRGRSSQSPNENPTTAPKQSARGRARSSLTPDGNTTASQNKPARGRARSSQTPDANTTGSQNRPTRGRGRSNQSPNANTTGSQNWPARGRGRSSQTLDANTTAAQSRPARGRGRSSQSANANTTAAQNRPTRGRGCSSQTPNANSIGTIFLSNGSSGIAGDDHTDDKSKKP